MPWLLGGNGSVVVVGSYNDNNSTPWTVGERERERERERESSSRADKERVKLRIVRRPTGKHENTARCVLASTAVSNRQTDSVTDRQTDRHTDRQTDLV